MPEGGEGGGGHKLVVVGGGGGDGDGGGGGGEGVLQGLSQAEHIVHSIWYLDPTHVVLVDTKGNNSIASNTTQF